jgi:uncharacterized membrane protein SirB2
MELETGGVTRGETGMTKVIPLFSDTLTLSVGREKAYYIQHMVTSKKIPWLHPWEIYLILQSAIY